MIIEFYGSLAETIGREIEIGVQEGATIASVRRDLIGLFPAAKDDLARLEVRAFVDDEMAKEEDIVGPSSVLAFLPPLSGG